MEIWNVLYRHVLEKQVTLHFKRCGLKKYGENVRENEMFYNVMH
jgi:hypothetical protein